MRPFRDLHCVCGHSGAAHGHFVGEFAACDFAQCNCQRFSESLLDAVERQPLKTEAVKRAIVRHRDCTQSCEKHGMYVIVGTTPNESCQVCFQEETNKAGADWAFSQIHQRDEEISMLRSDNAKLNKEYDDLREELSRRAKGEEEALVQVEKSSRALDAAHDERIRLRASFDDMAKYRDSLLEQNERFSKALKAILSNTWSGYAHDRAAAALKEGVVNTSPANRLLKPLAIEGLCCHCGNRRTQGIWHDERAEFECSDCLDKHLNEGEI